MLLDIARDGRVLLVRATWRREVIGIDAGETKERELSWLDYSYPADLSADGKTLLFDEEGGGGSLEYSKSGGSPMAFTFVRPTVLRQCCWVKARRKLFRRTENSQ